MSAERPEAVAERLTPLGSMLARQTAAEFLRLWRTPAFSLPTLLFPTMFFAFFGLPNADKTLAGVSAGGYLMASFGAYGVLAVMLFNFGAGVAFERATRMTLLMRATPLRSGVVLVSKLVAALVFALVTLGILFGFGVLAGGIHLPVETWLALVVWLLLGSLPFIALGFAVGYLASANAAVPLLNLIYLPLSFASGLFMPLQFLPRIIQKIAPYLPTYWYGQLAWSAVGAQTKPVAQAVLWLAGYGVVFALIALRAYWREDNRLFG